MNKTVIIVVVAALAAALATVAGYFKFSKRDEI